MVNEDFADSMANVKAINRSSPKLKSSLPKSSGFTIFYQSNSANLFDLVIENISEVQKLNDPVVGGETCAAAISRVQAQKQLLLNPQLQMI